MQGNGRITVEIDYDLFCDLEYIAEKRGITPEQAVEKAVEMWVKIWNEEVSNVASTH